MSDQFIGTVSLTISLLVVHNRWDDLKEYVAIVKKQMEMQRADITHLTASLKQSDDALAASVAANQPAP